MFKNIAKISGMMILTLFSFFFTEKTVNTVKNQDPLMSEINGIKDTYKVDAIDAEIEEGKFIPGMIGCEVDTEKSYNNLKRLGSFSSNLLIYKDVLPNVMLDSVYDKYIVKGNKEKNSISLIFKVTENDNIEELIKILDYKNVKATFFMDGKYIENNIEQVKSMIQEDHEILNFGYDSKYDRDLIVWNNNLIERINYDNPKFCYLEKEDKETLELCSQNKMHTIIPNIIVKNSPLIEVKNNIEKGSLISFDINDSTLKQINLVVNYINQKGYKIQVVSKHLKEEKLKSCKK